MINNIFALCVSNTSQKVMSKNAFRSNYLTYFLFSVNNAALFHCVVGKQPFSDTCEFCVVV